MTYGGPVPLMSDAVAVGLRAVGGPAGVPDARTGSAPPPDVPRGASRTDGSGVSAASVGSATPPGSHRSRTTRVLPGTRAKEAPMA